MCPDMSHNLLGGEGCSLVAVRAECCCKEPSTTPRSISRGSASPRAPGAAVPWGSVSHPVRELLEMPTAKASVGCPGPLIPAELIPRAELKVISLPV